MVYAPYGPGGIGDVAPDTVHIVTEADAADVTAAVTGLIRIFRQVLTHRK